MQNKRTTFWREALAVCVGIVTLSVMIQPGWTQAPSVAPAKHDQAPMRQMTPKLAPTDPPSAETAPVPGSSPLSTKTQGGKLETKQAEKQTSTGGSMPPEAPSIEKFPQVAELEELMFGTSQPGIPVDYRLDRLESEIFHHTNPHWQVQKRIGNLRETLVGSSNPGSARPSAHSQQEKSHAHDNGSPYESAPLHNAAPYEYAAPSRGSSFFGDPAGYNNAMPHQNQYGNKPAGMPTDDALDTSPASTYVPTPPNISDREFQKEMSADELQEFALKVINEMRTDNGLQPVEVDDVASKVAAELVADNCRRNTVSHMDKNGYNPDVRYTRAGGSNCMVETLTCMKIDKKPVMNRALVYKVFKDMCAHQDDRDALFNTHATSAGFHMDWSSGHDKLIACTEIVTSTGEVAPLAPEARVGDKLDVKGIITGPYKFARMTVAWEGLMPNSEGGNSEEQEEALPYFPPLDYEAFARKSEHDWQKGKQALQLAGITLAIAGGIFLPPVALAAPLIAASGNASMPKAISDIPVRGGVHVDGAAFSHKIPLSKDNKEGIYYITVWANSEADPTPFAVSRRAVIARSSDGQRDQDIAISQPANNRNPTDPSYDGKNKNGKKKKQKSKPDGDGSQ